MSIGLQSECYNRRLLSAIRFLLLLLLALTTVGRAGAASEHSLRSSSRQASLPFAIADFDGDNRPDLARVQVGQSNASLTRYWIDFQLSGGGLRQAIGVTAPTGGLRLASRDVNGDTFPDVVVTTAWLRDPVAVLLNDGHGNFTLRDPGGFPATIWESQQICLANSVQVRDSAAAMFSRIFSASCVTHRCSDAPQTENERLAFNSCRDPHFSLAISLFGRAPPAAKHQA